MELETILIPLFSLCFYTAAGISGYVALRVSYLMDDELERM
jgi:hypothetical protein